MIRYTSENQGHDKSRLLHSVPYGANREKITVYVSYDEGQTWIVSKCIVPYSSAYSSLCVLPDGTIGLYVEEAYAGASGYSTMFYNFSLEWLTDGNDTFYPLGVADYRGNSSSRFRPRGNGSPLGCFRVGFWRVFR